jgi:aspartyl-tRNA synthetase
MTWADALDRFGTDKPDLRFGMELVDLGAEFGKTEVRAFSGSHLKALCVPGGASLTRSRLDALGEQAKRSGAAGLAWFRVTGTEGASAERVLDSPLDRFLSDTERAALLEKTGAEAGDLILAVSDTHRIACTTLGTLRAGLGSPPVGQGPHRYVWVVDFPMFDGVDAAGNPQPAHHPFTMPYEDDLPLLDTVPFAVRSQAYDLVLNGWELGSGSVRIHRRDIQSRIFDTLGISTEEAEKRFGFLLSAFRYGAPPHAGFAFGIDRLAAVLAGEENIREVIAYPKTQSGADLLTGAPSALPAATLAELGIRTVAPPATASPGTAST